MLNSQQIYSNSAFSNQQPRYFTDPNRQPHFNTITAPLYQNPLSTSYAMTNPITSNTAIHPFTSHTSIYPITSHTMSFSPIIQKPPQSNPITFQLSCKYCQRLYGGQNTPQQPRILPCGHSYCQQCLNSIECQLVSNISNTLRLSGTQIGQMSQLSALNALNGNILGSAQFFRCLECSSHVQLNAIKSAPVNRLYYEMLKSIKVYLQEKQFQGEYKKKNDQLDKINQIDQNQDNFDQIKIKYDTKCLYMFCHNLKFEKDKQRSVYCSSRCREMGEALMAGIEDSLQG